MCVVHGGYFWQLGSVTSLGTETTGGVILVVFGLNMASEVISECLFLLNFSGGACPQTPLACSHHNGHTTLKQLALALLVSDHLLYLPCYGFQKSYILRAFWFTSKCVHTYKHQLHLQATCMFTVFKSRSFQVTTDNGSYLTATLLNEEQRKFPMVHDQQCSTHLWQIVNLTFNQGSQQLSI